MKTKQRIFTWNRLRGLLLGLALLLGPVLGLAPTPARAATFTISDQASCQAVGGIWVVLGECRFTNAYTVNAGNTLQLNVLTNFDDLTNNGTVNVGAFAFVGVSENATNNGTINVNSSGRIRFKSTIHNTSTGIINVNGGQIDLFGGFAEVLNNDGVVTINSGGSLFNDGTVNNNNLIEVKCGGSLSGPGTYTGNPVQNADCTPPAVLVYGASNLTTSAATVTFDIFFTEDVTGVDASDFVLNASGVTGASVAVRGALGYYFVDVNTGSGDGTLRVELVDNDSIRDLAGNPLGGVGAGNGNRSGGTFTIDRTAPNTTITSQPANPSLSSAASFAFSGSDATAGVARFECRLDSAAFAACTSPQNYTGLANGSHTFQVFAIDWANNVDASPASYTWVVQADTVAPTANPSQSPAANANGWNNSDVTVNWNWADNAGGSGIDPANCTTSSTSNGEGTLTLTANCKDLVGNTGNASTTVKVDKTAPIITASATKADGTPYVSPLWSNQDIIVHFTCSDGMSGIASCPADQTLNTEGPLPSVAGTAVDNAGNSAEAIFGPFQIDKILPDTAISSQPTNPSASTDASFAFSGSDATSGVASFQCSLDGAAFVTCTSPQNYNGLASGSHTFQVRAIDNADNVDTTPASYTWSVQSDSIAPTASPSQAPAANANGWNNSDVTITWNWTDNAGGSGIDPANCTTSSVSSGEGTLALTATCKDLAGNQGSASYTVKVDKTAPTITASTTNADGTPYTAPDWTNQNIVVHFTCSDAGSGIATCPADQTISAEGTLPAVQGTATDNAGNTADAFAGPFQIDKTKPTISGSRTPTANANGWNNSDVTVSFTCADNANGSTIGSDTVAGATVSSEGNNQSVTNTGTCVDVAGNVADAATVSGISIDKSKPTISAATTSTPNAAGWHSSNVTIHFTCADSLSGVSACAADQVLSAEGAAVVSTAQTVSDAAGNASDPSNVVTVKIDKTAPTVAVTGVSNGGSYTLGSVPVPACTSSDALSGVATQATLSVTGGNPDGSGSFIATCNGATDSAGNSAAPVSVSYTVTLPVDVCTTSGLLDTFNRANGGLGSNWAGLTNQSFYKIANNKVDVQVGGAVIWKPTSFGTSQSAFVTLSTIDSASPSQGVLLKVQTGSIPNAGAISVVYDALAHAVRVSALRLNNPTWTLYANTPATFANGDKLGGCALANGTVRIYKNSTLISTVTLSAADKGFFNSKGGKIGLWTGAAPSAFLDDFGGGSVTP